MSRCDQDIREDLLYHVSPLKNFKLRSFIKMFLVFCKISNAQLFTTIKKTYKTLPKYCKR